MKFSKCILPLAMLLAMPVFAQNRQEDTATVKKNRSVERVDAGDLLIWANNGERKIPREYLLLNDEGLEAVRNSVWDGQQIRLFGAKNEVVAFNLVVEAPQKDIHNLSFQLQKLNSDAGVSISNKSPNATDFAAGQVNSANFQGLDAVFDYTKRNIETFIVRYLPIHGLSMVGYDSSYDERHIPEKFRRDFNPSNGRGRGGWFDRPDHDKTYPDIAVPQEVYGAVNIKSRSSQSVWFDIFIPKNTPAGLYTGTLQVLHNGQPYKNITVRLKVRNFTLPDVPSAKTMLYLGYPDIAKRYTGKAWETEKAHDSKLELIRNRHFQMAHRHRISLIDDNESLMKEDRPNNAWWGRLNGDLFTYKNGYNGAGIGVGNGVFAIGMYGKWDWGSQASQWQHANNWVNWFKANSPETDYFLYIIDESTDYAKVESTVRGLKANKEIGRTLPTFATMRATIAQKKVPSLDIACTTDGIGVAREWEPAQKHYKNNQSFCFYNGHRPFSGSFMIEDDGVALRQLAWTQYKMGIDRWFYWESTYYNNFQGGTGDTDVFTEAHTFGGKDKKDRVRGETGWNYSNGDGVLFYPGTDRVFPQSSYGLNGPIASLRLKYWRRGLQDVDYLTLAAKKDPKRVRNIVEKIIPKVLWEYGVSDPSDPTWVITDISWSTNPDVWEAARMQLADIIEK